jgi:hypothetical protein
MTREVRPYPLMILVYAVSVRTLIALLVRREAGQALPGGAFAAYLIGLELMLWLHNLGPFWAAALGLAFLVTFFASRPTPLDIGWAVAGHAAVAIFYLPALAILADLAPTWVSNTWLRFSAAALTQHLPVLYAVPGWEAIAAAVLAALGASILLIPARLRLLTILLLLALLPTALSILVSATIAPVFISRTLTPVTVPTILLLAIGAVGRRGRMGWVGAGAAMLLAANLLAVDLQARFVAGPMQDWYRAVAWLERRYGKGDLILAYPNEGALPLERALKDKGLGWRVMAVPTSVPALGQGGWNPTGSRGVVSLPKTRLEAIARAAPVARARKVWLLRLGAETYDPGDMFLTALRRDRRAEERFLDGPIDIIGLERR